RRWPKRLLPLAEAAEHFGRGAAVLRIVSWLARMRRVERERAVMENQVAGRELEIVVGAESEVVVLLLRRRVDPATLIAAEGALLVVARDDVLAERTAERFEPKAEAA